MQTQKWYETNFRRSLLDMHIEDWDESFLSKFNPETYVELLKIAHVRGAMFYANSHVGYCYWPTSTGKMHKGIKGKDIMGEVFKLCHAEGMDVILYFTLIFDNWAYNQDPSWRIVDANGKYSKEKDGIRLMIDRGRYGLCCLNSKGYRDYLKKQIENFCSNYEFEGVFYDMTFWPEVCYCQSCMERYKRETGEEIPRVIDWKDPKWLQFQEKREEWLNEFAETITTQTKVCKPEVSVNHQFSSTTADWLRGFTEGMIKSSDYAGGDFYGGLLQQSFICKLFYSMTKSFEFHTSRCIDLGDHTTNKPKEMLELQNYVALAHNGAFLFIDGIDPIGTLNKNVYSTLGEIYGKSENYEKYLGGELCQDVYIWYNLKSKMDIRDNSIGVMERDNHQPHLDAAVGAARALKENHIPFGVISRCNLNEIPFPSTIVIPNSDFITQEEEEVLIDFLRNGGSIYFSGRTSPKLMSEIFGAKFVSVTKEDLTYISPNAEGRKLLPNLNKDYPLTVLNSQIITEINDPAKIMATITLPYTDPNDPLRFASIHSDPPGNPTSHPAIVHSLYGKGKAVWVSTPIENLNLEPHKEAFTHLIKTIAPKPFQFEVCGSKVVEMTMFHQKDKKRYVVNLVNEQEEFPPIPVSNIKVRIKLGDAKPKEAILAVDGKKIGVTMKEGYAELVVENLDIYSMILFEYI